MTTTPEQAAWFADSFSRIAANIETAILGKRHVVELVLAAAISGGHILLEDVPGTGKTALARALAQTIKGVNSRIQFTPDLLPGDITGIEVYDQRTGEFEFSAGPVFANVLLADEINRASPKTQSALLEVMEEGHVTVAGRTHPVGQPFIVIATQNPIEQAGTYRLPEAQLDRFMVKTSIGYPDDGAMHTILSGAADGVRSVEGVVELDVLSTMTAMSRGVYVNPMIFDYVTRIVNASRLASEVRLGVSVRGALSLTRLAKTWAIAQGRVFVTPDDVTRIAVAALAHRIVLEPDAEFDGVTAEQVIGKILLDVPAPKENAQA